MVSAFGFVALCLSFTALELFSFLNSQCGAGITPCGEAPLLDSAAEVVLPVAALGVLFVAVARIYHQLSRRHTAAVPVAGAGNGRRSNMFLLFVSAGTLEFVVFGGQAAGAGADHHGALGLAALHALPAAATATFFLGMMLIIVAHVRAGGEGGGGTGAAAVAGDGLFQGLLRILTKVAAGMEAALIGLMVMALTLYRAKF